MKKKSSILLPILFLFFGLFALKAQAHRPSWQQDVHYTIDVELDPALRIAFGRQKIVYTNHSPDTLRVLYLNLYMNAFKKNSLMEAFQNERNQYEGGSLISQLNERYLGYNKVKDIRNGKGDFLDFELDDTILKIILDEPVLPGEVKKIDLEFELKIPWLLRRAGWRNREGIEFSMAQWYPKLCVYDQKGWHLNYYLGREFYGEFATFDVSITLPENYVVGATGHLENAEDAEAMKLKDPGETQSDRLFPIVNSTGENDTTNKELESVLAEFSALMKQQQKATKLRTWRYRAEKVHDFAWCADPDYLYEKIEHDGVLIHLLYQPDVAAKWKDMKNWTVQILEYLNEHVGKYPYKDFTIAQAGDGGMEYPNIVFLTGDRDRKSLASVTAHEMAHNWFYGLMANNETMEAWLDEGITSYYTTRLMEHMFGRYANIDYPNPFQQKWFPKEDARVATYTELDWWIKQGYEEKALQHSDFFKSDRSHLYSIYYKGEIFMFTLQYYFGKERLDGLMRKFYASWHQHHVYTEDMKRFFETETGIELDWLFEEWLNTTEICDYAIRSTTSRWNERELIFENEIMLKRKGFIEMPIDLIVTLDNDSSVSYRIPAHTDDPDIPGYERQSVWNKVTTEYVLYMESPYRIKKAEIDTSLLLPDLHRIDNRTGLLPKLEWRLERPKRFPPTLDTYVIEHRPSVWYNTVDLLRVGYQFNGRWATDEHRIKAGLYYGMDRRKIDYEVAYSTPLYGWDRQLVVNVKSLRLEGRSENSIGLTKRFYSATLYRPPIHTLRTEFRSSDLYDGRYLPPGILWDKKRVNVLLLEWGLQTRTYDSPKFKTDFETATFGSRWTFSKMYLTGSWPITLIRRHVKIEPSVFGGYASGTVPAQEQFYIAGASPRQMFADKFYRSRGTLPASLWLDQSSGNRHLYYDGDGSMSGYADSNLFAKRIVTLNADLQYRNPFKYLTAKNIFFVTQFEPYFFYDLGLLWNHNKSLRKNFTEALLMDAGFGASYRLPLPSMLGNYILKSEFPLWVSKPERNGHKNKLSFRWLIGISNNF